MGLVWGLVVSAAGLAVLSVVAPPVTPGVTAVAVDPVVVVAAPAETAVGTVDLAKEAEAEPAGSAPVAEGETAVETAVETETAPKTAPKAALKTVPKTAPKTAEGVAGAASEAPAVTGATPEVAPRLDPARATALAMTASDETLAAPAGEAAPAVSGAEPAAPAAPAAPATDPAPVPDAGTMPAPKQDKLLDPPASPEAPQAETAPLVPGAEAGSGLPQVPVSPNRLPPDSAAIDPVAPDQTAPEMVAPGKVDPEMVAPETVDPEQMTLPEVALDPAGLGGQGATLTPDGALGGAVAGITTDRLPRIGDAKAGPGAEVLVLDPAASQPMITHAREFVAEPGKPKFAILLLDIGAAGMARDDLARLPFAITFVIDPAAPDAAEAARAYRAAGQEVMILASGLPEGATPADLEQSFQAMALALPQTVAMLDLAVGGLQENRLLATQAIPILKAQGRGIVTYDRGLGAAEQVAAREGLAHAVIFRELDAAGEDTPVIRRYLDRAAFKAAQEGQVLVIGQTRPETVAALLEWMVEGRGSSVQLAPVTAVMQVN